MSYGFIPARRYGVHFELACSAARLLKDVNFLKKGRNEREFEQVVVASLETCPALKQNLITQVGNDDDEVEKVTHASLFGFKHRPDAALGIDGTSIEIKAVTRGPSVRDLLGQALIYRMQYRFVILVLIDQTPERHLVELCSNPESKESKLLQCFCEDLNVFSVVGPLSKNGNVLFLPEAKEPASEEEPVQAAPTQP